MSQPPSASHYRSCSFKHEKWGIILTTLIRQGNEICKYFLKVDSLQHYYQMKVHKKNMPQRLGMELMSLTPTTWPRRSLKPKIKFKDQATQSQRWTGWNFWNIAWVSSAPKSKKLLSKQRRTYVSRNPRYCSFRAQYAHNSVSGEALIQRVIDRKIILFCLCVGCREGCLFGCLIGWFCC